MNWYRASTGVAVVLAMLVAGCGDDDPGADVAPVDESAEVDEEPDEPAEGSDEAENSAGRWTKDDIEYKLAVAGEGERLDLSDPVIDTYAVALDAAAEHCPEKRAMVGDISVRAVQILDEDMPTHNETVLSMLQAIAESAAAAEGTQDCSSIAATLIVLIMEG